VRAVGLAVVLLVLAGCAGSSKRVVRYDAAKAAACIRGAQPAEAVVGRVYPAYIRDAFYSSFNDDRIGTMRFILVVAYGRDRAAALRRERLAHADLKTQYLHLPRAWERSEGNVVYEALGPTTRGDIIRARPPGKTAADALQEANAVGARMKAELSGCLENARLR
jgi:hypothetical protein